LIALNLISFAKFCSSGAQSQFLRTWSWLCGAERNSSKYISYRRQHFLCSWRMWLDQFQWLHFFTDGKAFVFIYM